jgi:hypothetical protein
MHQREMNLEPMLKRTLIRRGAGFSGLNPASSAVLLTPLTSSAIVRTNPSRWWKNALLAYQVHFSTRQ